MKKEEKKELDMKVEEMKEEGIKKLDMKTAETIKEKIKKIGEIFPNVVTETEEGLKIDYNTLKQELTNDIIEGPKEKYQLTWSGKKEAIITANREINKTLRPEKGKSVDFDNTQNIYIEGDNLEALKILQESYLNKIKCIYIDPPYNTGNDFIYKDKFKNNEQDELKKSGQIDEYNNKLITNNETNGRFHSDWLDMIYPRLKIARSLLKEDGVMYISIDEHEINNLITLVNEIFGERNYDTLVWRKNGKQGNTKVINRFKVTHEYIVVAYKNKSKTSLGKVKLLPNWKNEYPNPDNDPRGSYKAGNISLMEEKSNPKKANYYTITTPTGKQYTREWFIDKETFERLDADKVKTDDGRMVGRIYYPNNGDGVPALKIFKNEEQEYYFDSVIDEMGTFTDARQELIKLFDGIDVFSTPKPIKMIKELVRICTNKDDIILDFFAGSSSTAHAVMELNAENNEKRKYIMIQLPEKCNESSEAYKEGYKTICDLGEERIRKAAKKIETDRSHNVIPKAEEGICNETQKVEIYSETQKREIDYGFRVYRVDESNMKDIYYEPLKLRQEQLNMFATNIKEDRTSEDLLAQVILDLGLTLDLKIEEKEILRNKVYYVAENSLVACFDDEINIEIINKICNKKPLKVVFRESSFKSDSDKINTYEKIKKISPETEISII